MSYAQGNLRARMVLRVRRIVTSSSGSVPGMAKPDFVRKAGAGLGALALAALWFVLPGAAAASNELSFGVFPQLSTRAMVETYQPLVDYLNESTRRPANLESAKDFHTFHTRTMAGEYDLVLTAPHLAWLAWKEGGYRPILVYKTPAKGFIVTRTDSPHRRLADLRGATIATPDPLAIINIRLERDLMAAGLSLDGDVKLIAVGTHTNAATHVSEKRTDAAIVGVFPFLGLPKEVRDGLRVIANTPDMPGHVFLVHPDMPVAQERAIGKAIEKFMLGESGAVFLKKTGFGGVRALKRNELQQVEGDAREFKRRYQAQTESVERPQ